MRELSETIVEINDLHKPNPNFRKGEYGTANEREETRMF